MRKYFIIFAATAALGTCSKDDGKTTQTPSSNVTNLQPVLPGEWKMIGIRQEGTNTTNGKPSKGTTVFEASLNKITLDSGNYFTATTAV